MTPATTPSGQSQAPRRTRVSIRPRHGWAPLDLRELLAYHELLYFLVWRTIKVRYRQTMLGAGWVFAQPLLTMVVFSVVLGRLAKLPSDGLPYPVFALAGLIPWTYFATALSSSTNSLVDNERLLTKVYFPRILLPLALVMAGLLDLAIALLLLVAVAALYGLVPSAQALVLPGFILLAVIAALGPGLWFSALNVQYRDVRHLIPFLTQVLLFITPVAYASSLVPPQWRLLYAVNPMASVVDGFRWVLLGGTPVSAACLAISAATAIAVLASGLWYFRRVERQFADVI
ncbi:MAG TPA: ABC transporter permease [Gemmatimonadales bacterium]|nr:ABC transporter permease [Gemmatimonadales bacterium]